MAVFVSPGVYTREIDLSIYAPQLSTSILGNIGTSTKGPMNQKVYVSNHAQAIRYFGNPSPNHLASLAHLQFFSKGNQSWRVRIGDGTEDYASVELPVDDAPAMIRGTEEGPFALVAASYGELISSQIGPFNPVPSVPGNNIGLDAVPNTGFWAAVLNAEFRVNFTDRDGASSFFDVIGLDISTAADETAVAALMEAAVQVTYPSVQIIWNFVGPAGYFEAYTGDEHCGSNAAISIVAVPGGIGTDISGAGFTEFSTGSTSNGTDGTDSLLLEDETYGIQLVKLPAGPLTADQVADEINNQTNGINAFEEPAGAGQYYVKIQTDQLGSTGFIRVLALTSTMNAYSVLGFNGPYPMEDYGTDGTVALNIWVNPWGWYRSNDSSANLSNMQAVTNGSISIALDGVGALGGVVPEDVTGIDLSAATDMDEVALEIQTAINAAFAAIPSTKTVMVTWSNPYFYFVSFDTSYTDIGPDSTIAFGAPGGGTNLLQSHLVAPGGAPTDGLDIQQFLLTPGSTTLSQIIADLAGLVDAEASAYKEVLQIATTMDGPAAFLMVDAASTADTPLGLDNSGHWGTPVGAATAIAYAPTQGTDGNNLSLVVSEAYQSTLHSQWVSDNPLEDEEDSPYYEFREAVKFDVFWSTYKVGSYDNLVFDDPQSENYFETILGTRASSWNSQRTILCEDQGLGLPPAAGTYSLSGGLNGDGSLSAADYIGVVADPSGNPTGLQIFRNAETLDVNIIIIPGVSDDAVIAAMLELCEYRGDCMCIIDPPLGLDGPQGAVDWSNRQGTYSPGQPINSSYGAIYWPWIKVYDSYNEVEVWTPPSGHAAAVYAYTDYIADPWWAPAGLNRAHILPALEIEMSPSQGDRDLMYGYPNVVNPIVNFFPDGVTIWGQKTAQRKPSATDRVNVRRLLLYAKKLVSTVVKYLTFDPNDDITRRQFVNLVTPIFSDIQSRRGVYEFRVICDETTNPPEVIDRNEMHGRIYLKPTKAAEIILVDFVIVSTGASFDEIEY